MGNLDRPFQTEILRNTLLLILKSRRIHKNYLNKVKMNLKIDRLLKKQTGE